MSSEVSSSTIKVSDTSIVDSQSPYYLNNSDNPGIHLVTKPLSGDNYHTWSRSMSLALSSKNKLGFVIGTVPQPNDPSDPLYDLWTRCNDLVLSWITSCLAEHISASVIYIKTAKGVWDDLKERYSQSNGPRVFHLKQAISSLKQEQYDVSSYYTVLKSLWDEFLNYRPIPGCSCGAKCILQQEEKQRGVGILPLPIVGSTALLSRMDNAIVTYNGNAIVPYNGNGVSTTYNGIQLPNVYSGAQLPSPYNGSQLAIGYNAAQITQTPTSNTPNTTALYNGFNGLTAAYFSRMDNGRPSQYGKKDRLTCSHCGFKGHTVDKCYKLHGYPPGFKGKNKASTSSTHQVTDPFIQEPPDNPQNLSHLANQCPQFLNMLTSQVQHISPSNEASTSQTHHAATLVASKQPTHAFSGMAVKSSEWIIDIGATDHMVISTRFFTTMTVVIDVNVTLPNGISVLVTHIGLAALEDDWFG
uniref:Retrotransposon Copia-like N-terminal domain-containing protein n=1 Tax=Fagus sylvatica TaxID=28930 RepID=A0A2N9FK13_FAGSY